MLYVKEFAIYPSVSKKPLRDLESESDMTLFMYQKDRFDHLQ